MPPRNEFVPVGKYVSSSRQLELDFIDQQVLISELKKTDTELAANLFVRPEFKEVNLGRIALNGNNGIRSTRDKLWVHYSEMSDGRRTAAIDLLKDEELTRFQLSQTDNTWQVWPQGATKSKQSFTNEDLVSTLLPKIRDQEALASLVDAADYEAIIIPRLLGDHLEKSAHRRLIKRQYKTISPIIQGVSVGNKDADTSFVASPITRLGVINNNGRFLHTLTAQAPYEIGETSIQKEYSYTAETSASTFYRAAGKITISSVDGYNEAQLAEYAQADQFSNEPLFSLHHSLGMLRIHYGLPEQAAA